MRGYKVGDYVKAIDGLAPFSSALDFDNVGLLVGGEEIPVRAAVLALDATSAVIDHARSVGANLIITHHPQMMEPLKHVSAGSVVYKLIASGMSLIAAHTNWDIANGGVNDVLAGLLGLRSVAPLEVTGSEPYSKVVVFVPVPETERMLKVMTDAGAGAMGRYAGAAFIAQGEGRFTPLPGATPAIGTPGEPQRVPEVRLEMLVAPEDVHDVVSAMLRAHPYEQPAYDVLENRAMFRRQGIGRMGVLPVSMTPQTLARHVKDRLHTGGIKLVPGASTVERVAVVGGSGGDLIQQAKDAGAQAIVLGECKHHHYLEARETGMTLIEAGHHATEAPGMPALLEMLRARMPGAQLTLAPQSEPVTYI